MLAHNPSAKEPIPKSRKTLHNAEMQQISPLYERMRIENQMRRTVELRMEAWKRSKDAHLRNLVRQSLEQLNRAIMSVNREDYPEYDGEVE